MTRSPSASRARPLVAAAGLASGLLALLAVAACSGGAPSVEATPSAKPKVRASGPLADPDSPKRVVYDERLVSDPLPASSARRATASMTAEQAIQAGTRVGRSPQQQPGTPSAVLRLVYPGNPDGAQRVAGKPTWVLTWTDSEPAVRGPATMTEGERRALADSLDCVYVVTVDPAADAATNSVQFCEKK